MNKKGFTLIELLAVIVLLVAITLITIPIVSNSINKSNETADIRSAEKYIISVDEAILDKQMDGNFDNINGCFNINSSGNVCLNDDCTSELVINANNKYRDGSICIENKKVTRLINSNKLYSYDESGVLTSRDYVEYTVTFNPNGGTEIPNVLVEKGKTISKPRSPYKAGYKVKEWQLNGTTFDFNTPITSNITLTAVWEETPIYTMVVGTIFNTKIKSLASGISVSNENVEDNIIEQVEFYSYGELPEGYTLSGLQSLPSTVVSEVGETITAYYDDNNKSIYVYSEGEIQWNNNSSSIFNKFKKLSSITIPDSVTSIGSSAFQDCTSLTSITIPDSVTSIGHYAFYNSGLTNITIPDSVTSIENLAFLGCSSLTSITIPNSVTSIGSSAFEGCSSLTNIALGSGLTSIGNSAFSRCSSLTSITIPNSVTSIGDFAFYQCSSLTSITIPNSVTSIGNSAFYQCSSLTSITIPDSVTSIGISAFYQCSSLSSITIPNSVTSIGNSAFSRCSSLTSITIPNSVTSIGSTTFLGCNSLASIKIDPNNTKYEDRGSNAIIEKNTNVLVLGCKSTVIPTSVTSIGNFAFSQCSSLNSITIPNSVTSIGKNAFYQCSNLTSATFENPNGWWYADTDDATSGTSLNLSNPSTNATYLKLTHVHKYWKRS